MQKLSNYIFFKRVFDILSAVFFLSMTSPLFLLISLFIKLSSKGPIFYPSKRMGYQGNKIFCWKFRTMYVDADQRLKEVLENSQQLEKEWNTFQKLKKDPRIIFLGRFLRKTSLDELPQLWNVLKGEMSLVGPRPYLEDQITQISEETTHSLLSVKPGLTGLWQVSGRSLISFQDKIRLELHYVSHVNFWFDVKIFFKTFYVLVKQKGAY